MATTKNITMKRFNGTDYDTLYPKTIASQIPDVYSKTNTITAETLSQLGLSANKLPNDAFQRIKTLIDNVQSSTDSKARIQTGSYVGTGTYGADNPCSLTFDGIPKCVMILPNSSWGYNEIAIYIGNQGKAQYGMTFELFNTTLNWYSNNNASNQFNETNSIYRYFCLI